VYTVRKVADPHHLNADPDPVFHFNANPDPAPLQSRVADPHSFHPDPDPDPGLMAKN
jgi:hypothetical protein